MGYRRVPVIHTIDSIPGEDGLVVRMKGIPFGRVRKLLALLDDDSDQAALDGIATLFVANLVSWNLEDEGGVPVPASVEGVDDQDFGLVLKMVNAWLDGMTGVSDDLGKGSLSGEKFPGQPLTMEAL
jgi:hypothetical protein